MKEKTILKQMSLNFKNPEAAQIALLNLQQKNKFLKYLMEENKPELFEKYKREKEQYDVKLIEHSYVKSYMILLLRQYNKLYNL